jgi:hypothetical protein
VTLAVESFVFPLESESVNAIVTLPPLPFLYGPGPTIVSPAVSSALTITFTTAVEPSSRVVGAAVTLIDATGVESDACSVVAVFAGNVATTVAVDSGVPAPLLLA